MSCETNIIGLRDSCTEVAPSSGFYIDELSIDHTFLNNILTKSYTTGEDLFNKKVAFAWNIMTSQVRARFSNRYRTASVVDGHRAGYIQENRSLKAGSAQYQGINVELCNSKTYLDLYVSKVEFFGNYTGNLTIQVYDLLQGRSIDTITLTGIQAGETFTELVNKTYKSDRQKLHLFFAYDATTVPSYDVTIGEAGCASCGRSGYTKTTKFINLQSAYMGLADTPIDQNLTGLAHTGGLSITYSLGCNHDDWLCEKKNFFGLAMLYKTGAEILSHALSNWDEVSNAMVVHRDKIKEIRNEYEALFINQLESVLLKVQLPNDNICFKCNPKSVTRIILP